MQRADGDESALLHIAIEVALALAPAAVDVVVGEVVTLQPLDSQRVLSETFARLLLQDVRVPVVWR